LNFVVDTIGCSSVCIHTWNFDFWEYCWSFL